MKTKATMMLLSAYAIMITSPALADAASVSATPRDLRMLLKR